MNNQQVKKKTFRKQAILHLTGQEPQPAIPATKNPQQRPSNLLIDGRASAAAKSRSSGQSPVPRGCPTPGAPPRGTGRPDDAAHLLGPRRSPQREHLDAPIQREKREGTSRTHLSRLRKRAARARAPLARGPSLGGVSRYERG